MLMFEPPPDSMYRLRKLSLKTGSRTLIVEVVQIDWIEAAGNYVVVHMGNVRHTVRSTMQKMQTRLAASPMIRIHKSTLVNFDRVVSVESPKPGEHILVLKDGTRLPLSRSYRERIHALLSAD